MKIAYLFNQYPSLTETFLAREVAALRDRGLDIEIFALEAGEGATKIEKASLFYRLNNDSFWRQTGGNLGVQLQSQGFTHIHATWANHIALIAWGAAQKTGLPWSFAAHARDIWVEGGDLGAKVGAAQRVFCCSSQGVRQLQSQVAATADLEKIVYAPHGIELEKWPFREWQSSNQIRLLGVGRLIEKKGWHLLLGSLAEKSLEDRDVQLKIIGDGPERSVLESQIKRLNLSNVELTGALSVEKVREQMAWANCFVLPSQIPTNSLDRDGLANVLIEAAAMGLPIITTTAGSAGDLVSDETGILLSQATPHDLWEAIAAVFDNAEKTKNRCLGARKRVEERFDVAGNVEVLFRYFVAGE